MTTKNLRELLRSRQMPTATVEFRTADDETIPVEFSAVPVFVYEDLLREHPPLEGSRTPWNPETFVPAVLAASSVPEELNTEFWAEYAKRATAGTIAELMDVVMTLNGLSAAKRTP